MFKKLIFHPVTAVTARLVLGVVFLYASWDKILDPEGFAKAVQNYRLVPVAAVNLFAIVIPWLELVCGLLLLAGLFTSGSALLVGLLMLSFVIALGSALIRGLDISCGCFSDKGTSPINYWYLLRDATLILLSLQILFCDQGALSLDRLLRKKKAAVNAQSQVGTG
jgi:uncharacterized membrane protein YphA (DoxX/SURF4 family)